jgi:hypothetical protein
VVINNDKNACNTYLGVGAAWCMRGAALWADHVVHKNEDVDNAQEM